MSQSLAARQDEIFSYHIVPVVVIDDAAKAAPTAEAMVRGGLPVAEVTLRTDAALDAIKEMAAVDGMIVGAGTVITPEQVEQAVAAGATFIVSPGFDAAIADKARELDVVFVPGVATPTEIIAALNNGLSTLKFFPASVYGGAPALKALAAPFSQVRFLPTGGVSVSNMGDYFALPAVAAVGGSWMIPRDAIAADNFDKVENLCREAVEQARALRNN